MTTHKEKMAKLIPSANRWKASKSKSKWSYTKEFNEQMNNAFMFLKRRVKRLYDGHREMAYERDKRTVNKENCTTVQVFLTNSIYLELECDYVTYKCYLHYDFQNCPHEATISKWLKEYPFNMALIHEPLQGGVKGYFNRVYQYQQGKHFAYITQPA